MKKQTKQKWLTALLMAGALWVSGQTSCTVNPCTSNPPPSCERVCNGSFEITNGYPTGLASGGFDQVSIACGWANGNTSTTPDLFNTNCVGSASLCDIPCNEYGKENERTGQQSYAGFWHRGVSSWNERIVTKLTSSLTANTTYEISFWLSLSDRSEYNFVNGIGFAFSNQSGGQSSNGVLVILNTSSVTRDSWTKMTYTFTNANNVDSDYLLIGSWGDVIGTPTYSIVSGNTSTITCPGYNTSLSNYDDNYYYIDDVSIREISPINVTASATTGCVGENYTLTASGATTYTWQPGNLNGTSIVVNPSVSTTYTVSGSSSAGCIITPATITINPATCCTNTNSGNINLKNATLVANGTSGATPWSSLSAGNYYYGNIAVPAGTSPVITNTLTIMGALNINTPVTFSLCNIFVNEDVPIIQNAATKIDRTWLRGCDKMWEGIVSKATLTVTNSFIEDAFMGINCGLWYTLSSHPGLIVDNSVFLKNWAGIAVGSCSMNPDYTTFKITGSVFLSRNVSDALHNFAVNTQYNSTLLPLSSKTPAKMLGSTVHSITANTIRSNIGIYVPSLVTNTTATMFTIGAAGADQTATDKLANMFDYMNCGIYNNNSKLNIYNCKFGNMINTGLGNAIGAVYHTDGANNAKNTITVIGGNGSSYYKNVFGFGATTQILDAVNAYNGGQLEVKYNDFNNITRYAVSIQNWAASTPSLEPVNVANNSYTNAAYGLYAYNNQGIVASYTANTITNVNATYTNNANVYIDDVGKSANSTFYINNNVLKTSLNGVYARNAQNVRVVDNTIEVAKPTSTSIYNGAVWFDNVDNGFVKKNIISCNPSNATSWNTYGVFANASTTNTYKCNTITKVSACMKFQSNCYPTLNYNNSLNNVSSDPCLYGVWLDNNGQTGHIGGKTGSTYEMADIVWGYFSSADTRCTNGSNYPTQYGTYYDNGKLAVDYNPQVNTVPGGSDLAKVLTPIITSSVLNDNTCNEQARMTGGNSGKGAVKGTKGTLSDDDLLESRGKKQMFLPVLKNNHFGNNAAIQRVIVGVNEAKFYTIDSLIEVFVSTKNPTALNSAKNVNASIIVDNNQEQNQKDLNDIYCVFIEDDSLVTGSQINYVRNLALMCPFTEGLSVYQARGLMRVWDDSTFYYNACESTIPDEYSNNSRFANGIDNNTVVNAIALAVYPNPSNGTLNVKINSNNCIFEVYDVIGKQIMNRKLNEGETKVDLSSLNNGTYLYKITQNNVVIKADKLILNK